LIEEGSATYKKVKRAKTRADILPGQMSELKNKLQKVASTGIKTS